MAGNVNSQPRALARTTTMFKSLFVTPPKRKSDPTDFGAFAANVLVTVKGGGGQTGNLLELQNSAGTVLYAIGAGGSPTTPPAALTVNGAIATKPGQQYVITKAGVLADTLAAPVAGTDDGNIISITSNTAFAHTLTATGLLQTGSASVNVATFAAFAGAGLTLMAFAGKWNVLYSIGITFS